MFGRNKSPREDFTGASGVKANITPGTREALLAGTEAGNPNSTTFGAAIGLMKPFWGDWKKNWWAYGAVGAIVALQFASVQMSLQITQWNGEWINSLVEGGTQSLPEADRLAQQDNFWKLLMNPFPQFVAGVIGISLASTYIQTHLELAWRRVMTSHFIDKWMDNKAFHRLQSIYNSTDNPEQRIQSDVASFTGVVLGFPLGLLSTGMTLTAYTNMLMGLSQDIPLIVGGNDLTFPGWMAALALGYAAIGTAGLHMIGKPLVGLTRKAERYEADFRADMGRVRENSENIALAKGEEAEKARLKSRFNPIARNNIALLHKGMQMGAYRSVYANIDSVIPFILAAPAYFTGKFNYSHLTQVNIAFGNVLNCFNWIINNYSALANLKAVTDRLGTLKSTIDQSNADLNATVITKQKAPAAGLN